jgi:phage terminase large subunit GpA-like protein
VPTTQVCSPGSARLTKSSLDYADLAQRGLAPADATDLWEWCCKHLRTYHGHRWDPDRARLMRFWYRVAGARLTRRPCPIANAEACEQIYLSLCSQIAKSTLLYAILLWTTANSPRRLGLYMPRGKDLDTVRAHRVERMLLQIPQLERMLPRGAEARERALGRHTWTIGTSLVFWLSASTAGDLSMHDLPLMLGDEIERWPDDVEGEQGTEKGEGDPIELALKRQRTYGRTRLFVAPSTPGLVHGHAWRRTCDGSHHRPIVLCPSCQGADWLNWRQVALTGGRKIAEVHPQEILRERLGRWACRHCGELHDAAAVRAMVIDCADHDRWIPGRWAIDADHPNGHWQIAAELDQAGRLINVRSYTGAVWSGQAGSLYSPDETVHTVAAQLAILEQGKLTQRKSITNTDLAEPWIHAVATDDADTDEVHAQTQDAYRRPHLPPTLSGDGWLLLSFDQQGNRREEW